MYTNEGEVARAIQDYLKSTLTPRSSVFITTKWNPPEGLLEPGVSTEDVYQELQASRKIFVEDYGLEYVDLMLVHQSRPGPKGRGNHWQALVQAQADGWIKDIGVSNQCVIASGGYRAKRHSNEQHLADLPSPKPAVNQIEVHPWMQQRSLTEYCAKQDIRVMAFCPLARANPDRIQDPVIVSLGKKYGKNWAQIILRWSLQKG